MATEFLQENYEFNAPPKVVQKMKYRDEACNIMWDKRVVRGNTYKSIINQQEPLIQTTVKRIQQQKVITEKKEDETVHHEGTQTDPDVEEQTDKPPRHQKETQTEFIIEKVVPRLYMKEKTGIDVETQIWDDGELFNFEYEAEPILQVLVQKAIDLSRMEVLQEEELREMKEQQQHYHRLKQAELAEQDRLEKKEQSLLNDNMKLKQNYHNQKQRDVKTHEKLVARVLSKQFLNKTQQNVMKNLVENGFFKDVVEIQLVREYLPWIYEEVVGDLQLENQFNEEYGIMINSVDDMMFNTHQHILSEERKRRAKILDQREQERLAKEEDLKQRRAKRKIRLEKERRQKLREQIQEQMVSKGEEKEGLSLISDIDGYMNGTPIIGHLGGIIGEFIIFINAIVLNGQQFEPAEYLEFVQQVLTALPETISIEIGVEEQIDQQLTEIDAELTLNTLPEVLTPQIEQIIAQNIQFSIQPYLEGLAHTNEIISTVIKCLLEQRTKLKFIRIKSKTNFSSLPCLIRLTPSLEVLPFHPKSGKVRPEKNPEDEATEEEIIINPKNLAEASIENKATAFIPQNEELQTVVIHDVSQFLFRQIAATQFGEPELPFLIDIIERCTEIENNIIEKINPNLAQIEIHQY